MNYQEIDAVNQSFLKALYYKGLSILGQEEAELFYEEKEHFIIGNMFDTIMTDPANFRNVFYVSELSEKPSATLMSVINKAVTLRKDDNFNNNQDVILNAMDSEGWHTGKGDKRLEYKAWKESNAELYWNELIESKDKQLVSSEEYEVAMSAAQRVMDKFPLFNIIHDITVRNQEALMSEYTVPTDKSSATIPIKGLIDQLILKSENESRWQEICKCMNIENAEATDAILIDYKTYSGLSKNYRYSVKKYRYDLQMSFYSLLVENNFANMVDIGGKQVREFFRVRCYNIVANLNPSEPSFIWHYQDEDLDIGEHGAWQTTVNEYHSCEPFAKDYTVPGFAQMLQRYHWYKMNNFETEYGFDKIVLNESVWSY